MSTLTEEDITSYFNVVDEIERVSQILFNDYGETFWHFMESDRNRVTPNQDDYRKSFPRSYLFMNEEEIKRAEVLLKIEKLDARRRSEEEALNKSKASLSTIDEEVLKLKLSLNPPNPSPVVLPNRKKK